MRNLQIADSIATRDPDTSRQDYIGSAENISFVITTP